MNVKVCGDVRKSASPQTTCHAVNALGIASAYFFIENLKYRWEKNFYVNQEELELGTKVLDLLSHLSEQEDA